MKNYLFTNKIYEIKRVSILILTLFFIMSFGGTLAYSQGMGMQKPPSPESKQTLEDQISDIRSKLFNVEVALERRHQGKSEMMGTIAKKMEMNKMAMMGMEKMEKGMNSNSMQKMPSMDSSGNQMTPKSKMNKMRRRGMKMMGRMNENRADDLPSSLPGFPGMSHIYHIGSTGFFLDHSDHIKLTRQQKVTINKIKEQIILGNSVTDREIQQLEQDLWVLTSSDQPDIAKIDEKIRGIEHLKGNMRNAFIQAVGKAAKVLSSEQLNKLKGMNQDPI